MEMQPPSQHDYVDLFSQIKLHPPSHPDPRTQHLVFSADRYPYFKDHSMAKQQAVKYFMNQKIMVKRDQVEAGDFYGGKDEIFNKYLDGNIPEDQEYDSIKPEDKLCNWPQDNFVYIRPQQILNISSRFPKCLDDENKIPRHFLQNQAWTWRFKYDKLRANENANSYIDRFPGTDFDIDELKGARIQWLKNQTQNMPKTKDDKNVSKQIKNQSNSCELARRVQCVICLKIAKIPAKGGEELIVWEEFKLKMLSDVPDYSQFCQAKYCHEYRILLVEQLKERQEAYKWQHAQHLLMESLGEQRRNARQDQVPCISDSSEGGSSDSD